MEKEKRKIYYSKNTGCRGNYQDIFIINEIKKRDLVVEDPNEADIILFLGTCIGTEYAINLTMEAMNNVLSKVENLANKEVIVTGCLTRKFTKENVLFTKIEEWLNYYVTKTYSHYDPYSLLNDLYPNEGFARESGNYGSVFPTINKEGKYDMFFYITEGCNNKCTFCKSNYANFPLKSMRQDHIKELIDYIGQENTKTSYLELIGKNLSQYGYDLYQEYKLPEIIEHIEGKNNIEAVRLSGFNFYDAANYGFHDVLRDSEKVKIIDGSLESGSNRLLKLIGKNGTIENFMDLVKCMNSKQKKDLQLAIIAGFPTETMEDVKMTLEVLKEINPSWVGICRYSDSSFVKSHEYEQLPVEEIQEHARIYQKVLTERGITSRLYLSSYKYNSFIK